MFLIVMQVSGMLYYAMGAPRMPVTAMTGIIWVYEPRPRKNDCTARGCTNECSQKKKTLKESAAVLCDDHLGWQVYDDEQQQNAAVALCVDTCIRSESYWRM